MYLTLSDTKVKRKAKKKNFVSISKGFKNFSVNITLTIFKCDAFSLVLTNKICIILYDTSSPYAYLWFETKLQYVRGILRSEISLNSALKVSAIFCSHSNRCKFRIKYFIIILLWSHKFSASCKKVQCEKTNKTLVKLGLINRVVTRRADGPAIIIFPFQTMFNT